MNREKAKEIFTAYGRPQFKIGQATLSFSRQTEENLKEIESKTDEELIDHWKNLVFMNEVYGQVSLNDMQRIDLIELEFQERPQINIEELKIWFKETEENFVEEDFH